MGGANNTKETAALAANFLKQFKYVKVIVATSQDHAPRALRDFVLALAKAKVPLNYFSTVPTPVDYSKGGLAKVVILEQN